MNRQDFARLLGYAGILILVVNIILIALHKIQIITFWFIILLVAGIAYVILPKITGKPYVRRRNR